MSNRIKIGKYNFTSIRSGIIIGSGSASFEIIKVWLKTSDYDCSKMALTRSQPLVSDVIKILNKTLNNSKTFNKNFDIGGPEIIFTKTY